MTQKARPFPSSETYTPAIRQYLNRLSTLEIDNDTQFQALTARLGTLESESDGMRVDIAQLQQDSSAHAAAIDQLNARDDALDIDLDGAIQSIEVLSGAMDQVEAVNATQTADIATLQENVADLQMTADLAVDSLAVLDGRVTAAEGRLTTAETDIQSLRYADASFAASLNDTQTRLDAIIEAPSPGSATDWRLPLSDAILGTVPKVVGTMILPAGDYAAPGACLGCPTTPAFTATLTLVADGVVLTTLAGPGRMTWQTAALGFTLADTTAIDLLLVGSSASALALIEGFIVSSNSIG